MEILDDKIRRTWERILIMLLLLVNAMGALLAGYSFIVHPDGQALGMDTTMLRFSPFDDFFVPGIILFGCNGLLSLFTLLLLLWKKTAASRCLTLQGIVLVGWIIVQMIMLREVNFLHLLFGLIGLLFLRVGYVWTFRQRNTDQQQAR